MPGPSQGSPHSPSCSCHLFCFLSSLVPFKGSSLEKLLQMLETQGNQGSHTYTYMGSIYSRKLPCPFPLYKLWGHSRKQQVRAALCSVGFARSQKEWEAERGSQCFEHLGNVFSKGEGGAGGGTLAPGPGAGKRLQQLGDPSLRVESSHRPHWAQASLAGKVYTSGALQYPTPPPAGVTTGHPLWHCTDHPLKPL